MRAPEDECTHRNMNVLAFNENQWTFFESITLATKALNDHTTLGRNSQPLDVRTVSQWAHDTRKPPEGLDIEFDNSGNKDLVNETWVWLDKGGNGVVGVSNMGRFRNEHGQPPYDPCNHTDHHHACVTVDGVRVSMSRLVASVFHPVPSNLLGEENEIDHVDGKS